MGKSGEFPDKIKRKICWDARDVYWSCLDKYNGDKVKCPEEMKLFENSCPKLWVTHFNRKREYIKYKEQLEKEDPMERQRRMEAEMGK